MKLEIKHLSPYFPYKLQWYREGFPTIEQTDFNTNADYSKKDLKPLLLPLSALTEQLPDGSVPIVELMDKSFNTNWAKTEYIYTDSGKNEWWVAFKDQNSCFGYNSDKQGFYSINGNGRDLYVHKQLQLFEYLFANQFDVFGLIDAGLAIDKRTLK